MERIPRESLRERVRDAVRERIVEGELEPGAALREATLSAELGVSRTPVREALWQLEREGMVKSAPERGFSVAPLTVEEAESLFPIVGALHGLALREMFARGEGVSANRVMALRVMNAQIREWSSKKVDAAKAFAQDVKWHGLLLAGCGNARLMELIGTHREASRRYDLAYFREAGDGLVSADEHDGILDALERGDVEGASRLLEAHWVSGVGPLRAWLVGKEGEGG